MRERTTPKRAASAARKRTAAAKAPAADDAAKTSDEGLSRRVGESLKRLRQARDYSLEDVAALTGVSRATLSQIETAKTNPSIGVLWKISNGLGVPFSTLLGETETGRITVVRRGDQGQISSADGAFESRPLAPSRLLGDVEVYELTLAPKSRHDSDAHPPGTREGVFVLAGIVRVSVSGLVRDAGTGDSVFFLADAPHVYENAGRAPARLINVIVYMRT